MALASIGRSMGCTERPENWQTGYLRPLTLSVLLFVASTLTGISGLRATSSRSGSFCPLALREAQNLAFTGLNLVARNEGLCDGDTEGDKRAFPLCQLPGAVHLLPLVQFFIGLYCQALQDLAAAKRSGAPGDSPTHTSCLNSGVEANPDDSVSNLEGFSAASLSILQHLVCHSRAVVCLLLSVVGADSAAGEGNESLVHRQSCGDTISIPNETADDQGLHPLLKMLLHLLAFSSAATGHIHVSVLSQCLKVLVKLAENASSDLLPRYKAAAWEA